MAANQHDALSMHGTALFAWVTPIVAVTLVVGVVRGMKAKMSAWHAITLCSPFVTHVFSDTVNGCQ